MRTNVIYNQDCLTGLGRLPAGCAQLVLTSPPYPGARPGRVPPARFLPWFIERAFALKRVLAERGNFFLNIDDCIVDGEEVGLVHRLALALKEVVGLRLIATYHWAKPNAMPGAYGPRLKDAHEFIFHFARSLQPQVYPEAVRRPYRECRPVGSGLLPGVSRRRSGRAVDGARMFRRGMGDPGNVFIIAVGGERSEHPTPMPMALARAFVQFGSAPGDLVVDPFAGGGTTLVAARDLGRPYVGFEIVPEYARAARRRLRRRRPLPPADQEAGQRPAFERSP